MAGPAPSGTVSSEPRGGRGARLEATEAKKGDNLSWLMLLRRKGKLRCGWDFTSRKSSFPLK